MAKKKSVGLLEKFMKCVSNIESVKAAGVDRTSRRRKKNKLKRMKKGIQILVRDLHKCRQIVVTSQPEMKAVCMLKNEYDYTGDVRFPSDLNPNLENELDLMATQNGFKISRGQRPQPQAEAK